jgi:hypothetical protein
MKNENIYLETEQILLGLELMHPEVGIIPKLRHSLEGMTYHSNNDSRILDELFNTIKSLGEYDLTFPIESLMISSQQKDIFICVQEIFRIFEIKITDEHFRAIFNHLKTESSLDEFKPVLFLFLDQNESVGGDLKSLLSEDKLIEKIKTILDIYSKKYEDKVFENLKNFYKHYLLLESEQKLWELLHQYTSVTLFHRIKRVKQLELTSSLADSFSKGQVKSKIWAVDELQKIKEIKYNKVYLMCGWYGLLARLLFDHYNKSGDTSKVIQSIDIDESCKPVADCLNYDEHVAGRFISNTDDILNIKNIERDSLVINTSCEHLENFKKWMELLSDDQAVLLQSNDYFECDQHVNCAESLEVFIKKANLKTVYFSGELQLEKYKRFMIIGLK